jgi:hypothetical protein
MIKVLNLCSNPFSWNVYIYILMKTLWTCKFSGSQSDWVESLFSRMWSSVTVFVAQHFETLLWPYLQWSLVQWRQLTLEETPSNGAQSLQKNLVLNLRTYWNFTSYHIFKTSVWSELDWATPLHLEMTHDDVLHGWWIERGDLKSCQTLLSCALY